MDHHLILDLLPPLTHAYFSGALPASLSYSQAAILAVVGLQQHDIGKVGGWVGGAESWLAGSDVVPPRTLMQY